MKVTSYKDLMVWQKAMDLVEICYHLTDSFPRSEEFGLKSQMRRAAISISSNVAEGNVRHASREYCRFLAIALGSTVELETQGEIAKRLRFLSTQDADILIGQCQEIGRMLNGLRLSIANRALPPDP
jgi:four helix bundle protein